MIGAVEGWRKWALFAMRDGGVWNKGPIALLGDASHAMLPFAAQGAAIAIEDAYELALMLATHSPAEAFRLFCARRKPRVAKTTPAPDASAPATPAISTPVPSNRAR